MIERILPTILTIFTGYRRHKVNNLQWNNLWSYNLFRVWEMVFWRRNGQSNREGDHIRKEASARQYWKDGKLVVERKFFTWEAMTVHYEAMFRLALKRMFAFQILAMPKLATPLGMKIPLGYSFAIARDTFTSTSNSSGTGTTQTLSYTVTGSNPALFVGTVGEVNSDAQTSMTYASVDVPKVDSFIQSQIRAADTWFKGNPATGANDIVVTKTNNTYSEMYGVSFSGAQSGNTPDSNAGAAKAASTSFSQSTSVVASDCWLVGFGCGEGGGTDWTAGAGTAMDFAASNEGSFDSNGTVGTGSQTLNVNTPGVSQRVDEAILSFAPSAAAAVTPLSNLLLMGVG